MEKLWLTPQLKGLNFTKEEVELAELKNTPLLLTLYTKGICNAKCPSCFITNEDEKFKELSLSDYERIIIEAKEIGIKSIKFSGAGEPLIIKDIISIIKWCYESDIIPIIYTNGSSLGDDTLSQNVYGLSSFELIDFLDYHNCSIVYKFNSAKKETQDFLLGVPDMSEKTYKGIFNLLFKNYNKDNRLAFQTIITPYNITEVTDLYMFARRNNVIPYFETVLKKGEASANKDLYLSDLEIKDIFITLSKLDREQFGFDWFPVPSYVNFQCTELGYAYLIDNFGYIRICPGIWDEITHINNQTLMDVWNNEQLRQFRADIKKPFGGKCGNCAIKERGDCGYGCRAYAYLNNGELLGEYSECWW